MHGIGTVNSAPATVIDKGKRCTEMRNSKNARFCWTSPLSGGGRKGLPLY